MELKPTIIRYATAAALAICVCHGTMSAFDDVIDIKESLIAKTNLAQGAKVTSDSEYGAGYEARNAADGDFATRWASAGINGVISLVADLGEPKEFNQVCLFETEAYSGRIDELDVYVSDDGEAWEKWGGVRPKYAYSSITGTPVTRRYVKVDFKECSPEGINVDELMVFNDPTARQSDNAGTWRKDPSWITQQPGKAANIYQQRKAALRYGMFIHYGMNTFLNQEWSDGTNPASAYNPDPDTLDPEQWVKAAWEGGMNFIILVTKHHEGFSIWDTAIGDYNINHTGRESDRRDIVKEVADACRKYGIKFGVYYSAWDRNWDMRNTMESTGLDRIALAQKYNDYALAQVTELMDGRYGEISEFWIDGSWVKSNAAWEFDRLYDTVKRLQPTCQMAINCTIRGKSPDQYESGEELYFFPSDFRLQDPMFTRPGKDADPKVYSREGKSYYLPFEATICINNSWFWSDNNNASSVIAPEKIVEAYNHMVEQDNTLVLNLAPGRNGLMTDYDIEGLYAGARALGIARGDAMASKPGDCKAVIECVTEDGDIAWPTEHIYGNAGDSYSVEAPDLRGSGYRLMRTEGNPAGEFSATPTTIRFIYKDIAADADS